jgi:hypothetical protein
MYYYHPKESMKSTSPRFSIDGVDFNKVLTGLLVGLAGVGITILSMFAGANYHVELFGTDVSSIVTMAVAAVNSALVNLLRKYVTDHSQQ